MTPDIGDEGRVARVRRNEGRKGGGRDVARGCGLLLLLAAVGCGDSTAQGGTGGPRGMGQTSVAVETDTASLGSIARQVSVTGTVNPIRTIAVNAQLGGALMDVLVQEGDTVAAGGLLARIDDRELQAQLRSAEASFEVAEAALRRAEQLRARQVITEPEYERDRAAFEAARAQRDQLLTRAGFAEIRAPIAGVVTEKLVESGDVVGNQTRLFSLADVSTMVVRVSVSELDVVELAAGSPAAIRMDAYPGTLLPGRILRIFPAADPGTRLVPVEVAVVGEEARSLARPGFLARATFDLRPQEGALLVPQAAVVARTGGQGVYVVGEDQRAALRSVTTGATQDGRVQILSGLNKGERIVVAGSSQLRDGAEVRDMGLRSVERPDRGTSEEGSREADLRGASARESGPGEGVARVSTARVGEGR